MKKFSKKSVRDEKNLPIGKLNFSGRKLNFHIGEKNSHEEKYPKKNPKKHLGQNFLNSSGAVFKIVEAGKVSINDLVVEIGPGKGVLTEELLKRGARVVAFEKDPDMIAVLKEKFAKEIANEMTKQSNNTSRLTIIEGDFLEQNLEQELNHHFGNQRYKIIANIPYYITGMIIEKILTCENQPELTVLLVQKEVAERIISKDGKESILSVSVKAYSKPKMISVVKAGSFFPKPKVDSAILLLENISRDFFSRDDVSEKSFFEVVKAGFAHKRKKLGGNLKTLSEAQKINPIKYKEHKDRRAEDLDVEDWRSLTLTQ